MALSLNYSRREVFGLCLFCEILRFIRFYARMLSNRPSLAGLPCAHSVTLDHQYAGLINHSNLPFIGPFITTIARYLIVVHVTIIKRTISPYVLSLSMHNAILKVTLQRKKVDTRNGNDDSLKIYVQQWPLREL